MAPKWVLLFLYCVLICVNVNSSVISDNTSNVGESHDEDIFAVFSHLNSTPFKVYNYKQATLLYAHKKADITELAIDITAECSNKYPDVPCIEGVLTCHSFVQSNSEGVRQVINDVNCKPKPEIIIEEVPPTAKPTEIENTVNDPKTIALSNEAASSEVGDHFVAVRKNLFPCAGCPFDLNPEAEGVDELIQTALRHIESERSNKHTLIKVLKLQQQVVSGIKYILVAEIAPTVCPKNTISPIQACPVDNTSGSLTCRITYLQQPWISRAKHVIGNNCTVSQEFDISVGRIDNEVGFNKKNSVVSPNFDHIAESGSADEMSPFRLADLESQIIVERDDNSNQNQKAENSKNILSVPSTQPLKLGIETASEAKVDDSTLDKTRVIYESDDNSNQNQKANSENESSSLPSVQPMRLQIETASPEKVDSTLGTSTTEQRVILNEFVYDSSSESNSNIIQHEESPVTSTSEINSNTDSSEADAREKRSDESIESSETNSTVSENLKQDSSSSEESSEEDEARKGQAAVKNKGKSSEESDESTETNSTSTDLIQISNTTEIEIENVTVRAKRDIFELREKNLEAHLRPKRAIQQLEKISPEEKHTVMNLADFAANALDHIDDDNHKRLVLQILGAKKMVGLDGVYYHLIMRMGVSLCLEDEVLNEECREKLFENYTKICKVQVFVNDDFLSPKLVKSQCQNIKKDKNNNSNRTNYGRFKRQEGKLNLSRKDVNSDNIQNVGKSTIESLNENMKKNKKFNLVKIKSAKSAVFEKGTYYILKVKVSKGTERKMCVFQILYETTSSATKYKIKCDDGEFYKFKVDEVRRKRQIPGGLSEVSHDDDIVQRYVEDSLRHLDSESSHDNKLKVQEIISATSQVVAGHIYRIKVKVILSDCKKNDASTRAQCGTLQGSESKICDLVIFNQAWKKDGKLTNITCEGGESHSFRAKRDLNSNVFVPRDPYQTAHEFNLLDKWNMILSRAQPIHVDKYSKHMQAYFKEAIYHFNCKMGFPYKMKPVGLNAATKQAVAGQAYKIEGNVAESDCPNNSSKDLDLCQQVGDVKMSCTVNVLDRPWLKTRDYSVTCGDHEAYVFDIYGEYPFKREFVKLKLIAKRDVYGDDSKLYFNMFNEFIRKYNKQYDEQEFNYRFKVFKDNIKYIRMLNTYEQGTAWYGISRFADLTRKEFSKSHGLRTDLRNENDSPFAQAQIPNVTIPTEFDWRKKGAVSEVKNQEQCGSCWAFSVTGNVEGQYAIKHGKLLEFSEQELVDCDKEDQGCDGGLMDTAYRVIEKLGGLETEQDYPYDAQDEKCHFNKTLVGVQLTGALNISQNETDMAKWLVGNGPISIAINANAMQFYMGGVSHPFKFLCNPKNLDHGVLIVGYGVHTYPLFKKSLPYWIVKNSWGTDWGEQGYYRVYRGDGTCGLNQTPSSAIVA